MNEKLHADMSQQDAFNMVSRAKATPSSKTVGTPAPGNCPFCGSPDTAQGWEYQTRVYIFCRRCGARGPWVMGDDVGAISSWNMRSPVETTDVRIKNLTRALHAKQAKIDALMLEFCPGEMQAEQKSEWAEHQQRSLEEPRETSRDDARDAARYRYIRQGEDMLSPEDEDHYNKMWQTILPKGCDRKRMDTAIDAAIAKSSAVEPSEQPPVETGLRTGELAQLRTIDAAARFYVDSVKPCTGLAWENLMNALFDGRPEKAK